MTALFAWPVYLLHLLWVSLGLALGQIWTNKTRSALTTLGIVIGVASVTAVIAALTGLERNVLQEFESLGTNKIFIIPGYRDPGQRRNIPWDRIRFRPWQFDDLLSHCPSVGHVSRFANMFVRASHADSHSDSVQLTCIEPAYFQIDHRGLLLGRPLSDLDNDGAQPVCLVNPKALEELHLPADPVGESILIEGRRYLVVGVLEARVEGSMFNNGGAGAEIWVPFNTAWRRWRMGLIAVATSRTPELSEEAQAEIRFFLRHSRRLNVTEPDNFFLEAVEQYLKSFQNVAAIVTTITACVVAISLVVGGIGIMNIMLASVSERTREIGLRMAVGARPGVILLQFLVEAATLALLGGLLGMLLGQLLAWIMSLIPGAHLQHAAVPLWAIGMSFAFSGSVGVIFGIFPAVKASRLNPIDALRHE